jgi:tetratricopeptide (TPR) repeat protein
LLASGVGARARRKAYLARLDRLAAEAGKATAGLKTPADRGRELLRWLHAGPLARGYAAGQTRLDALLDTGKFNCVSSAVLYNALGQRLGLDLRAVEVPDHVFAILYDGARHADVETTTRGGFDPARDPAARAQLKARTGFTYIPDSKADQRREIRAAGLVAIVYYNRGVELTKKKRYHEALLCYFRALSLDREFVSAVKNALAVLANWGVDLARQGRFEDGLEVISAGLELAPDDATLRHNRKVFWSKWAEARASAGKKDEAVALLRKAARQVPGESAYFLGLVSWVYLRQGEALARAGKWEQALAAVEPGLTRLDGPPREEVRRWRRDLRLRWAQAVLDGGEHEKAVALLARALAVEKDDRAANNLCYTVGRWARHVYAGAGEAPARALLKEQLRRFPALPGLRRVAEGHVHHVVAQYQKAGKHESAYAAIDRHADLLDEKEVKDLVRAATDAWARHLRAAGQHDGALGVYEKGLKRLPGDGRLKNNLVYTMQEWVGQAHARKGEAEARAVLARLRRRFPAERDLDRIARVQAWRVAGPLAQAGQYDKALAAVERHAPELAGTDKARDQAVRNLSGRVYDDWAATFTRKGDWEGALGVYAKGLKRYPKDRHLENNAVATWNRWAFTFMKKKLWDDAIKVYERALKQFPKNSLLENNLNYCKAQKKR